MIDGFDEPNTSHLKQVVQIFSAIGEFLYHAQNQTQIPIDHLLSGLLIPLTNSYQQFFLFLIPQHWQFCGIHPTDLYFIQIHLGTTSLLCNCTFW